MVFCKGLGVPGYYLVEGLAILRSVDWLSHSFKNRVNNMVILAAAFYVGSAVYEKVA